MNRDKLIAQFSAAALQGLLAHSGCDTVVRGWIDTAVETDDDDRKEHLALLADLATDLGEATYDSYMATLRMRG